MKGDTNAAALRLMSELTVHTHERKEPTRYKTNMIRSIPKENRGRGRSGGAAPRRAQGGLNRLGVLIQGITYPSIRAASAALKVGNTRIYNWLDSGRATYEKGKK